MTSARIIVEIPDTAKGEMFSFRDDYDFKYPTPSTVVPKECKYASVYNHLDGYINKGLGDKLVNSYTNFKDIMEEIVCGGDCSYVGIPYHAMRNEDFSITHAKFTDTLDEIQSEDYNYLFKANGNWYVRERDSKEFIPLTKGQNTNQHIINEIKAITLDITAKLSELESKINLLQ